MAQKIFGLVCVAVIIAGLLWCNHIVDRRDAATMQAAHKLWVANDGYMSPGFRSLCVGTPEYKAATLNRMATIAYKARILTKIKAIEMRCNAY